MRRKNRSNDGQVLCFNKNEGIVKITIRGPNAARSFLFEHQRVVGSFETKCPSRAVLPFTSTVFVVQLN